MLSTEGKIVRRWLDTVPTPLSESEILRLVTDHVPSMLAYWDDSQICRFANEAYRTWFGKNPSELIGNSLQSLLGPLYELNLPYIQGALRGEAQLFERRIPSPDGKGFRDSLATYIPDISGGVVRGFVAQVSDVSLLKQAGYGFVTAPDRRDQTPHALGPVDPLSVCAWCTSIKDKDGTAQWVPIQTFVAALTGRPLSHGICPSCYRRFSAELSVPA
jgi:PAS domain S-box-containing protein